LLLQILLLSWHFWVLAIRIGDFALVLIVANLLVDPCINLAQSEKFAPADKCHQNDADRCPFELAREQRPLTEFIWKQVNFIPYQPALEAPIP